MSPNIEKLKDYFTANEPNYGYDNVHSMLDFLFMNYIECNPLLTDKIWEGLRRIEGHFDHLTVEENDAIFDAMAELYMEQERVAFLSGFRVGFQLAGELQEI